MLRTSNPILTKDEAFAPRAPQGQGQWGAYPQQAPGFGMQDPRRANPYQQGPVGAPTSSKGRMTMEDVLTKTLVVMGLMILVAAATWASIITGLLPIQAALPLMVVSGLGTVVLSLVVGFRSKVGPVAALLLGVLEGVFVGMISMVFEQSYPGIVVQAVFATLVVAAVMLVAYRFKVIRVTPVFTKVLIIATVSFGLAMLLNFALAIFGVNGGSGLGFRAGVDGPVSMLAIGVSILGVVLASLNLILDFDLVERGVRNGAPASQSWLAAFGLTVTMVWLYIEILRIISYFRR
ncbi:hypothetical protein DT076_04995 [Desertihabitans brevis]|uniref:Bax inhibitor-1/YccA family protein n=1 Tax=Desertihabitans brevis TaxID=2268447 RepID=A0A367YZ27_9ACTN|nr:Bax inhibitor-1/YccA family protein [Desertihabitans brevis]RCK70759.1 hypothetical protein DT076_04995 [Desertihabitans brevis]